MDRIIGKKVKTIDHQDAGKVVTTLENEEAVAIIISSEGVHRSSNYKIPENLVRGFDGPDLIFQYPEPNWQNMKSTIFTAMAQS